MLPHEKELVERLKQKPFALLGIDSDEPEDLPEGTTETADERRGRTFARVREILAESGITWRQAVDGSTSGPIATRWNVHAWPTIYILDSKGVIRHRGLRGQAMEDAVLALLAEMDAAKQ